MVTLVEMLQLVRAEEQTAVPPAQLLGRHDTESERLTDTRRVHRAGAGRPRGGAVRPCLGCYCDAPAQPGRGYCRSCWNRLQAGEPLDTRPVNRGRRSA